MNLSKKDIRKQFFLAVFNRDKKCRTCGAGWKMSGPRFDAHHITDRSKMPNGGYVLENGIFLCPECHLKAEKFHASGYQEYEPGFHPDDLYKLIGSSHEKAVKASEGL